MGVNFIVYGVAVCKISLVFPFYYFTIFGSALLSDRILILVKLGAEDAIAEFDLTKIGVFVG